MRENLEIVFSQSGIVAGFTNRLGGVSEGKFKEKLKAKFVFLSVGELEKRKGKTDKAGILKASDLALILKQSGVNSHFELFKNETHGSVIPLNLKELLKYLKD